MMLSVDGKPRLAAVVGAVREMAADEETAVKVNALPAATGSVPVKEPAAKVNDENAFAAILRVFPAVALNAALAVTIK